MHVVIFEVEPKDGRHETYFETAASLRSALQKVEGFISVERFESLTTPGKVLSLSTWEDEAAICRWREQAAHHDAQTAGRDSLFERYRIRVAEVVRDYDRDTSPWRA
ncbi:MAG: antibiotic biosynthesis monooxygenase [Thalassobaculaceae bacterium]|nr:antibiotic biosynthesis monooxygenase [Thalassobaculaceae bacterium]